MKLTIKKFKSLLLAVLLMAGLLVLNPTSVLAETLDCSGTDCIEKGVSDVGGDADQKTLFGDPSIFNTITNTLLFLVGVISVIMLIIGGIRYVVSGGDQNAVTGAKNTILYAIIGIIVAFLAFAAVKFITNSLAS